MQKRKRRDEVEKGEHDEGSVSRKKARREEDALGKFLSLVEAGDILAGLTYFLTTVQREGGSFLISAYLQQSPSCEHFLAPLQWERDKQTYNNLLLCFECLENVLLHTASLESLAQSDSGTGMGLSPGHKLVSAVLRDHMRPIYSSLMTSCPMKLVAACLRLLTAMVLQGHHTARDVQQSFNFGYKPLIVFPNRTHRVQGSSDSVRTYFIKFALSFLIVGDNEVIRNILELKRFLSSVFKLLPDDHVEVVHLFLSTVRQKVLRNSGVSKRAKSALFNHYALKQLSSLLSSLGTGAAKGEGKGERGGSGRKGGECFQLVSQESGEVVSLTLREYVLEVLMELCTSFQFGVCYRTKIDMLLAERTNNPAILQLLLSLTGSLHHRSVQDLITRAIATCPDILTPYLQTVALSFEPRPKSKWIDNVEFLTNLFSGLPSVPETLGVSGCGQADLIPLVPAAVSLTVPRAVTRTMFNQGVQNATPLVRLKTLTLMAVILKRAADTALYIKSMESVIGSSSSFMLYSDSVLKLLPELKTLINLRQQLLVPARATMDLAKRGGDNLTHEQRIHNAALLEDSSLLSECLAVMRGYQLLSPSLFAQADFNPTKLLPSLSELQAGGHTAHPAVLASTLRLLEEAPGDYFNWRQQKSGILSSLLWLVVCGNEEISRTALDLTLKLLLSVVCLSPYVVELGMVLTAARRFCLVCLSEFGRGREETGAEGDGEVKSVDVERKRQRRSRNNDVLKGEDRGREVKRGKKSRLSGVGGAEPDAGRGGNEGVARKVDERVSFVSSLAEMFSALTREPQRFMSEDASVSSSDRKPSLQNILAGPLKLPTVSEVIEEQSDPVLCSSQYCLLLPALISSIDTDKYFPFVCDVVIKLLLTQDNSHHSKTNARLLLSLTDKWKSRSWSSLYHSLVSLLQYWVGDTSTNVEVDHAEEAAVQLPSRKVVKQLKRMTAPAGSHAVELFCSLNCEQLLECVAAIVTRGDLRQALLYYCDLRPLHLLGCHNHPAIQDLLPSLPLSTLVLQSFQLEPSPSPEHSSAPLLPLSRALAEEPLRLWQGSLLVNGRDSADIASAARVLLAVLLELYRTENVELVSAAEVCFHLLGEILEIVLAPKNESKSPEADIEVLPPLPFLSSESLLATVFNSPLVQSLLSTASHTDNPCCDSNSTVRGTAVRKQQRKRPKRSGVRARGRTIEVVCLERLGRLLSIALGCCEEFKGSDCFSSVFQGLLHQLQSAREDDEYIGRSLLGVIEAVRPHLNSSSVLSATEQVLHSLTTSTSSPPHQSLLSQALLTLLTPHLSLEDAPTNNDAFTCSAPTNLISHNHSLLTELKGDTPVDYPTNWVPSSTLVGESGLQQLLNATVRTSSDALSQAAFYLVCSRLCVSPGSMSVSKWIALEWSSYRGLESGGVTEQPGSGGHMPVHPLTESERGEFCRQLAVVAEKITVKGLSPSFLLKVRDRFLNSPSQSSDSWLSNELLTELLDCSGGEVSITQCSLIGCILLNIADRTLEYFSTTCVPELCSRVESSAVVRGEGRARSLETALFLLTVYLTAIVRVQKTGRESEKCKESVKLVRKSLLEICSTIITSHRHQYSSIMQGLSVRVLCLLCHLSSQARKKLRTMAENWNSEDTSWTRHQLWVVGVVGCVGRDASLCALAASWLLRRVVCIESEDEEWREECFQLLHSVLVLLVGVEKLSHVITPPEWNGFVEKSLSGSVKLSSVLSVLCAGVKVMCWKGGEGDGEGELVNRELMTLESLHSKLWSHPEFHQTMFSSLESHQTVSTKENLVELLVFLTERCAAVCDTGYVATLFGAYSASRSRTDRGLLYLLLLYELNGVNVGKFKPYMWGEAGRKTEAQCHKLGWLQWEAPGTRQVLDSLDSHRMKLSLEHFPQHAGLEPVNLFTAVESSGSSEEESAVYDPAFMLPLLSHLLDPASLVECRGVVDSGSLSYLLSALSSHVSEVRMAATHCLSRFAAHLRTSTSREKPQISLLLRIVKNTLQEQPQRLPSLHTAFCAQVAHIFLRPELLLYPVVGYYIVHKPVLEVRDIPLFYTLLHSSSAQHCSERGWLLGVLVSGLQSEEDYRLYQRKRVLPHLMALYTAPCMDSKARALILELLLRACSFSVAASDLVWNHGLLVWLSQVTSCRNHDVVQKILSVVCRRGLREEEGEDKRSSSSSKLAAKPPPLLEEELALTTSRLTIPS